MLDGSNFPKILHKLVLPENVFKRVFYTAILGEKGPKVAKLVDLTQIFTLRPLIRPQIHEWGMLEGSKFPKSLHKLILPENLLEKAFYTTILYKKGPKVAKLVDLT